MMKKFNLSQMTKSHKKIATVLIALPVIFLSARVADHYFEVSKNMEIFTDIYKELNIYYVDDTKPGAMMKAGIDAMLRSLDPYTVYYPESKIEDAMFMQTGQYGGIGTLVNTINGKITITEPYQNYPAAKNGLMAGDVVIKVDGVNVEGKNHEDISDMLTGQPGSAVAITIMRPGESAPRVINLTREDIKIPDVPYFGMIDTELGYIKLTGFTQTASSEVKSAFLELKKRNMKQLVLDLRGNGGGLMREAISIVNFFVPKGTEVVRTKGKIDEWNKTFYATVEPMDTQIPLVVLVDGMSASASEIVSGSLQDLDRAVVVGTESYGKGLVQQTKDLAYNTKLKLTVAKYYTPSGRCIQRLDYSHRDNATGKVNAVADSVIKSFKTRAGRVVYDGRGISPDRLIIEENPAHVLVALADNWVAFDWANQYRNRHATIDSADRFRLSDKEYDEFVQYALTRDFAYETGTEKMYADLLKAAKEEKYYEGAESAFEQLSARIHPDKSSDLRKFKKQIKQYLENEIVARYYYQDGRVKNSLPMDPYLERAKLLFDGEYNKILTGPLTGK
jgi:carboxyl-terminal processing protease